MVDIPLPRPDPRGPPVQIGGGGLSVLPPVPQGQYNWNDHLMAALRAVFEGEKTRQSMAPYRDQTGLYDRKR